MKFLIWEKWENEDRLFWKIPFKDMYVDNFQTWIYNTGLGLKLIKLWRKLNETSNI